MNEYSINFAGKDNSVNKNSIKNIECFKFFNNYSGPKIGLNRFINMLYNDNWTVTEEIINPDYKTFKCYSSKYNAFLFLSISTLPDYIKANNIEYYPAMELLDKMAINAKKTNNKIINIQDYQNNNKANDNSIIPNVKNLIVYSTSKRVLSKKAKIALATLAITVTAVITGVAIANLSQQNNNNKSVNDNQTSYSQDYNESPIPNVSQDVYRQSIEVAQENSHAR